MANFKLLLPLFLALVSLSLHANARSIGIDPDDDHLTSTHDQALTNPKPDPTLQPNLIPSLTNNPADALAPVQEAAGTENIDALAADTPSANGIDDEKNFIAYGGMGGWGGVGGWVGVLPIIGGLGKVGGVGVGGGVGGVVGGLP